MLLNSVTKLVLISFQCLIVVSAVSGSINENVIDTWCDDDGGCKEFVKIDQVSNSTCFNHQCICRNSDFITIPCFPEKQGLANVIGGKCPCTNIKWSSCMDGFCKCSPDYIASEDRRSCILKKVPLGSRCENHDQCSKGTAFATCSNSTCSCESGFTVHNGACQSLVVVEKHCANDTACPPIPNTNCVSQRCYCQPGYVATLLGSTCLPIANYNENCSESVQCQQQLGPGAVCEQFKCICGESFFALPFNGVNVTETVCERRIAVGQPCAYDTDCFQSHFNGTDQSMHCSSNKCQCAPDHKLDLKQRFCIKSENTMLQSTWFDSIMAKVSSTFAISSGNLSSTINYFISSMLIVCFALLL